MKKVLGLLKKIFLTNINEPDPIKLGHNEKICPECEGTGNEDIFVECDKCNGKGVVKMTYKEYVESLPK